jgi:hypothetical protein
MKYTGWCQNDFNVQGYSWALGCRHAFSSEIVAPNTFADLLGLHKIYPAMQTGVQIYGICLCTASRSVLHRS